MPSLGRLRGNHEFSGVCLLFVLGGPCLSFGLHLPSATRSVCLCPWHHFHPQIFFPTAAILVQASLSSAWMVSAAVSLLPLLVWPLRTTPALLQVGHPLVRPPLPASPDGFPPLTLTALHELPPTCLSSSGPHCCPW